jgi:hypothetical protein
MLVHLLKTFPNLPEGRQIREALDDNLNAKNIAGEVAYLNQNSRASFERTYGWAWLLKLAEELHGWNDEEGQKWSRNLQPLAEAFAEKYIAFLPKQNYPIRTGVHPNTAFGLAFAFDYARATGDRKLESLIVERSRTYFAQDVNYPGAWEPGGEDFFSPAFMEADLMRRVMTKAEFSRWFHRFLPGALRGHPARDPARKVLANSATAHAQAALPHVASGSYEGEHWLASFAVYLLTTPAP